jgi:hypothetical protein
MGLKVRDIKRIETSTSAGSSVLAHTVSTTSNSTIKIRTELLGRRNFNTDSYCKISESLFKNVAGTVSQVGTTTDLFFQSDTSINLSTLTFTISGTNIQIYINGDPDVTVLSVSWELIVYIEVN